MTVPLVFDFDAMVYAFLDGTVDPTVDNIETAGCRLGRNNYPSLVYVLHEFGILTADAASVVVPGAWCAAEFPAIQVGMDEWRELFDLAGYTESGTPAARPDRPLTLWRGGLPEFRNGWSWTDDREQAEWFAGRRPDLGKGVVWVADIAPALLLARITERGEGEYVVDTRGLPPGAISAQTREAGVPLSAQGAVSQPANGTEARS